MRAFLGRLLDRFRRWMRRRDYRRVFTDYQLLGPIIPAKEYIPGQWLPDDVVGAVPVAAWALVDVVRVSTNAEGREVRRDVVCRAVMAMVTSDTGRLEVAEWAGPVDHVCRIKFCPICRERCLHAEELEAAARVH